jgi:hypothetical protein
MKALALARPFISLIDRAADIAEKLIKMDDQDKLRGGGQTCGQRQRDEQLNVLPLRVQRLDVKRPVA